MESWGTYVAGASFAATIVGFDEEMHREDVPYGMAPGGFVYGQAAGEEKYMGDCSCAVGHEFAVPSGVDSGFANMGHHDGMEGGGGGTGGEESFASSTDIDIPFANSMGQSMVFAGVPGSDMKFIGAPIDVSAHGAPTAYHIQYGENSFISELDQRKCTRKETMKLYMRSYRRRQKSSLENLPTDERDHIVRKQRERVRERVRRHRMRKKLRAAGLVPAEIERRLQELVPSLSQRRAHQTDFSVDMSSEQRAIPLPFVFNHSAASVDDGAIMNEGGHAFMVPALGSLCHQLLPHVAPRNAPFVTEASTPMQSYVPGQQQQQQQLQMSNPDFDQGPDSMPPMGIYQLPLRAPEDAIERHHSARDNRLCPSVWTTSQVGIFLDGLKLGHLKSAFDRANIDGASLMEMTPARLLEMLCGHVDAVDAVLNAIDSLKQVTMFN